MPEAQAASSIIRIGMCDEAEARLDIAAVERFLSEGYPAASPASVTTSRSAVRMAAEARGIARQTMDNRIGSPRRAGSHKRRFKLEPDWSLAETHAAQVARARRGELGTEPVLTGFELSQVKTRYDGDGKFAGETITQIPASGPKFELPPGQAISKVTATVKQNGQLGTQWIRYKPEGADPVAFAESLREAMQDCRGLARIPVAVPAQDDELLTVYVIPDLHLGMLAWAWESGESYDLRIAADMARTQLARLLAMAPPARNAVLLFLGDYFHMNDRRNVTPRSGHTLDTDGRWRKVYDVGARLAVGLAEAVAERHDQVEIAFLPGNHDEDAAQTLAVALDLFFERHSDRIKVAGSPGDHWFRRFGNCLLGASHGHTMKPDRMAWMLATDRARDWGETEHRHFFFGHIHHETAKEVGPVRVESFTSPAAKDSHASQGGYRSNRALNAVTFHIEDGEHCRHRVSIRTPQPAVELKVAA